MLRGSPDREMAEEEGPVMRAKVKRLAAFVRASKYAVKQAFLQQRQGFLISVDHLKSSWTLQVKGKIVAKPDFTENGVLSEKQTELHRNYYFENLNCPVCDARYFRSHAVWEGLTMPLSAHDNDHRTGHLREADGCSGELENSVVFFGESLPAKAFYARCDEVMRLLAEELHLEDE